MSDFKPCSLPDNMGWGIQGTPGVLPGTPVKVVSKAGKSWIDTIREPIGEPTQWGQRYTTEPKARPEPINPALNAPAPKYAPTGTGNANAAPQGAPKAPNIPKCAELVAEFIASKGTLEECNTLVGVLQQGAALALGRLGKLPPPESTLEGESHPVEKLAQCSTIPF